MNIIDVRDKVTVSDIYKFKARKLTDISAIAVHHSGCLLGDAFVFARGHVKNRGWAGIGYHYVILKNGYIQYCGDLLTSRANVRNYNNTVVGICLIGDFSIEDPTYEQLAALNELMEYLKSKISTIKFIYGHIEFKGQLTSCPCMNMNIIRNRWEAFSMADSLTDKQKVDMLWEAVFGKLAVSKPFVEMKYGDKGDRVKNLQTMLNKQGAKLVVDGSFGPASVAAVKAFEKKVGAIQDGVVDSVVYYKLVEMTK